jgi:hypothetical protein
MGMIHPTTALEYWYSRLPMGASNSPGISGRYGAAFLWTVVENCEAFKGESIINNPLLGQGYYPSLGEGRVLMGPYGKPGLIVWINVDDVFVYDPTRAKLIDGLNSLMDTAVRLGLI